MQTEKTLLNSEISVLENLIEEQTMYEWLVENGQLFETPFGYNL